MVLGGGDEQQPVTLDHRTGGVFGGFVWHRFVLA
jgi:hypothetical protein